MNKPRPVFVADTCIGGLSVLRALRRSGHANDAVFLADYEVNPLGVKSDAAIEQVVNKWLGMAKRHSDKLVIACNTLSIRYRQLFPSNKTYAGFKQIVSMVDCFREMIRVEAEPLAHKKILVLGTEFTSNQALYPNMLAAALPGVQVDSIAATELERRIARFLPLDYTDSSVLNHALRQAIEKTDIVVLACTCFPMVKTELQAQFPRVRFLDPGAYCQGLLEKENFKTPERLSVRVKGNVVSRAQVIEFANTFLVQDPL